MLRLPSKKAFLLLELEDSLKEIKDMLGRRSLNPIKMSVDIKSERNKKLNVIDVLHLLEYFAKQGRGEFDTAYRELYSRHPELVREALEVARVLSKFSNDPESLLAKFCIEYVEGR